MEQLPAVLWAYRTTPKHSIVLSPFYLAYGSKVVLPTKYMMPTSRTKCVDDGLNNLLFLSDKALLEETKLQEMKHMRKYQLDMKRRYDKRVKKRTFCPGDWVLKRVICSSK